MLRRAEKLLPPGVPGCLKKRHLLNQAELSPALAREYGEKFLALSWWEDALEFFQKGQDAPGLEKIKALCLETGDAYLLGRLGKQHEPHLWLKVAEKALELNKLHFALRAFEKAGEKERAAALARLLEENHPNLNP